MKKLNVTFNGVTDATGYLFSLAKCFMAALKHSEYSSYADDIIAASGFAFRMWVDGNTLCPSATSIWEFKRQKEWFENSGLVCDYIERLWGEDAVEEERRFAAIEQIKCSIDRGIAAVAWDISGCEWGLLIGYDDQRACFATLKINGQEDELPYDKLGKYQLPIMSVISVACVNEKSESDVVFDTKKLAFSHLNGDEWCDNSKGLAAYDTIIEFIKDKLSDDCMWNLEYNLGTYAALKYFAWDFFNRHGESELAELYKTVFECWKKAFDIKRSKGALLPETKSELVELLTVAKDKENQALNTMNR